MPATNVSTAEFDNLLRLLAKFNPDIDVWTVCDAISCERCPFDKLTPRSTPDSVKECMDGLRTRLDELRNL